MIGILHQQNTVNRALSHRRIDSNSSPTLMGNEVLSTGIALSNRRENHHTPKGLADIFQSPPVGVSLLKPSSPMAAEITAKLAKLERDMQEGADLTTCSALLTELKIALTNLPGLQASTTITNAAIPDITLARDVYEVATLLSVKQEDETFFERHVAQVKTYYVDYAGIIPQSKRQNLILGLNLMRLMAQNRIAEFHTELELVPTAARADKYIAYALRLENYLMEGSYAKIREEKISIPDPSFAFFVEKLMITVCEEIAGCSERAYRTLPCESAQRLLSINSDEELLDFCEARGWRIENGTIYFSDNSEKGPSMDQVASEDLIKRSLEYARELEQII